MGHSRSRSWVFSGEPRKRMSHPPSTFDRSRAEMVTEVDSIIVRAMTANVGGGGPTASRFKKEADEWAEWAVSSGERNEFGEAL